MVSSCNPVWNPQRKTAGAINSFDAFQPTGTLIQINAAPGSPSVGQERYPQAPQPILHSAALSPADQPMRSGMIAEDPTHPTCLRGEQPINASWRRPATRHARRSTCRTRRRPTDRQFKCASLIVVG